MDINNNLTLIGNAEFVNFPELGVSAVPARIDTGAKTSAVWASGIIEGRGILQCVLFGPDSEYYSGKVLRFTDYETRTITSSMGTAEQRYVVKLLIVLKGKRIRAWFTLANRSEQMYPLLIGRNVLRAKFLVDVKHGIPQAQVKLLRTRRDQANTKPGINNPNTNNGGLI